MEYRKFGGVIVARLDPARKFWSRYGRSPYPSRSLAHIEEARRGDDLPSACSTWKKRRTAPTASGSF